MLKISSKPPNFTSAAPFTPDLDYNIWLPYLLAVSFDRRLVTLVAIQEPARIIQHHFVDKNEDSTSSARVVLDPAEKIFEHQIYVSISIKP